VNIKERNKVTKRNPVPDDIEGKKIIEERAQPKSENDAPASADLAPEEVQALSTEETKAESELSAEELNEQLKAELAEAQALANEYLDGWQRQRAEFANYKKRIDRNNDDSRKRIAGEILTRYLPIVDDLERALENRPSKGDVANWAEGIELVYQKLKTILESEEVETIPAEGLPFDPNFHEALTFEENNKSKEGYVIEVVQKGYKIGDRVLRPALVRVAK
jgi:molecular chaperone GrpE